MSEDSLLLLDELKMKVHLLFGEVQKAERNNAVLAERIAEMDRQKKILEEQMEVLTKKYENLKLAKALEAGYKDIRPARLKINKLVREIDKCVALLNE